jgi:iron(III) transport system substrate-binding protein
VRLTQFAVLALASFAVLPAIAQEKVLNLYSARHYQTDEALYTDFTKKTGIKINRIEAGENELLERLRNEGAYSPADVFLTVDAARLGKAEELGLFAPVKSAILTQRIPAHLRTDSWFAFSQRARVIVANKARVNAASVRNYEDLAHPRLKGMVCVRSGAHPYNLSLGAAMLARQGAQKTQAWAEGLVANFARAPKGGDTDQIKAVAAGECGVTLANSYYVARMLRSEKPEDKKTMENVTVIWPNQQTTGAHINISGGGMLKTAPNKDAAVKFLEYLVSDQAQVYFADGNNEWPVVASVKTNNPGLGAMGKFKSDTIKVGDLAAKQAEVQKIYDRAGWR